MSGDAAGWGMLERTRALDYVTLQGLSTLTGCEATNLDALIMKELVDNGLDAASGGKPRIGVTFETGDGFLKLTVRDNGVGMLSSDIERIVDFNKFYSTKFHDRTPSRGALGNATKETFSVPYALAADMGVSLPRWPIGIRSRSKEHRVRLVVDELREEVKAEIAVADSPVEGTEISITLPVYRDHWGWNQAYVDLLQGYAMFNPEADFELSLSHSRKDGPIHVRYPSVGERKRVFKGRPSIHWFGRSEFAQLVWAKIRAVNGGGRDESLRSFIGGFRGLSSFDRINDVLGSAGASEDVLNVSDLADREDLVERLFDAMKRCSMEPKPYVLGEIGEEPMRKRLEQIFKEPEELRHNVAKGIYKDGSTRIPYAVEIAVAVYPENTGKKKRVIVGINNAPCLGHNPFDRCTLHWSQKGEENTAWGVNGLLEKYGIKKEEPVVVVIHLISPRVEYTSYGKSELNTDPFKKPLAQTLYKTCKFYYHHKRGGSGRGVGQKSEARRLLAEELRTRDEVFRGAGGVPGDLRTTQQGLYYKIRKRMGGKMGIERKSFIAAIREESMALGRRRDELGIIAAVRAEMYFRGSVYPVSLASLGELAGKGSDILLVEKEGITLALEPYARGRGVALVNSRGFIVEYADDLMKLSREDNANIFQLTDYDASGLLISQNAADIPRIGVDPESLDSLGLWIEDVSERYKPPKKHLNALPLELRDGVRDERIEIDSVLAEVGSERLWAHLEDRMTELAPRRDLTRSLDLSINLPWMITEPLGWLTRSLKALGETRRSTLQAGRPGWNG
nr:hypothetical protein [Candidatus Bathyarchaeota archaeon]